MILWVWAYAQFFSYWHLSISSENMTFAAGSNFFFPSKYMHMLWQVVLMLALPQHNYALTNICLITITVANTFQRFFRTKSANCLSNVPQGWRNCFFIFRQYVFHGTCISLFLLFVFDWRSPCFCKGHSLMCYLLRMRAFAWVLVWVCACMHVRVHACVHAYVRVHVLVLVCLCWYACVSAGTCACAFVFSPLSCMFVL